MMGRRQKRGADQTGTSSGYGRGHGPRAASHTLHLSPRHTLPAMITVSEQRTHLPSIVLLLFQYTLCSANIRTRECRNTVEIDTLYTIYTIYFGQKGESTVLVIAKVVGAAPPGVPVTARHACELRWSLPPPFRAVAPFSSLPIIFLPPFSISPPPHQPCPILSPSTTTTLQIVSPRLSQISQRTWPSTRTQSTPLPSTTASLPLPSFSARCVSPPHTTPPRTISTQTPTLMLTRMLTATQRQRSTQTTPMTQTTTLPTTHQHILLKAVRVCQARSVFSPLPSFYLTRPHLNSFPFFILCPFLLFIIQLFTKFGNLLSFVLFRPVAGSTVYVPSPSPPPILF